MEVSFRTLYDNALDLLRTLTTEKGMLASAIEAENYKRIWARDGIICGLAAILSRDKELLNGMKNTLLTLAKYQHPLGMIPSNVVPGKNGDISFGGLSGRVDTATWFIIGACLYYHNTKDKATWRKLRPAIKKCRVYLKTIEFNANGWIYTPMSGNWADEYPVHGYTLYDNMLRIWGEELWSTLTKTPSAALQHIKRKSYVNFWPRPGIDRQEIYQKPAFDALLDPPIPYFSAFILPGKYDRRFDAAGNAIALLNFNINAEQKGKLADFLELVKASISKKLIPAFWPVIQEENTDWEYMKHNYTFAFKNEPHHFHNGGIWPVWMGLFCLGLSRNGLNSAAKEIVDDFTALLTDPRWDYQEYLVSNTLVPAGKRKMGFSAAAVVFMYYALQPEYIEEKLSI